MNIEIWKLFKKLEEVRLGIPQYLFVGDIEPINVIKVREDLLKLSESEEVDIILHSPGGSPADAYRLIRTFRKKYKTVNVVVPFWAKSAATLFAFGASRVVFSDFGEFGPLDVQIKKDDESDPQDGGWESALNVQSSLQQIESRSKQEVWEMYKNLRESKGNTEIKKIGRRHLAEMLLDYSAKFYQPLLQKIETIEIGSRARRLDIGKMYAKRILKQYTETSDENIDELLDFLVYSCPDHGYVVDYSVIKSYLPNVIRAAEEPFGLLYEKELEALSVMFMKDGDLDAVGFLNEFQLDSVSNKITLNKNYADHPVNRKEGSLPSDKGPSDRPEENASKENAAGQKSVSEN